MKPFAAAITDGFQRQVFVVVKPGEEGLSGFPGLLQTSVAKRAEINVEDDQMVNQNRRRRLVVASFWKVDRR